MEYEIDRIIFGEIAIEKTQTERTTPYEGLKVIEHNYWDAALILVDPSEHDDGQKIAFNSNVLGDGNLIIPSLLEHAYSLNDAFIPVLNCIKEKGSFVDFIAKYPQSITNISFDMAMPNMFKDKGVFMDETRRLRGAGITNMKNEFKSDGGGIDIKKAGFDEIVPIVEKGGGEAKAVSSNGEIYQSEEHIITEDIELKREMPKNNNWWGKIKEICDRIF